LLADCYEKLAQYLDVAASTLPDMPPEHGHQVA
jgi:hypothetical protein